MTYYKLKHRIDGSVYYAIQITGNNDNELRQFMEHFFGKEFLTSIDASYKLDKKYQKVGEWILATPISHHSKGLIYKYSWCSEEGKNRNFEQINEIEHIKIDGTKLVNDIYLNMINNYQKMKCELKEDSNPNLSADSIPGWEKCPISGTYKDIRPYRWKSHRVKEDDKDEGVEPRFKLGQYFLFNCEGHGLYIPAIPKRSAEEILAFQKKICFFEEDFKIYLSKLKTYPDGERWIVAFPESDVLTYRFYEITAHQLLSNCKVQDVVTFEYGTMIDDEVEPEKESKKDRFKRDLSELINQYNYDTKADTFDHVLADYLYNCLKNYIKANKKNNELNDELNKEL